MILQLLLTWFFIKNKTKPNTIIESFPCWNGCMWALYWCITSLFMFLHHWLCLILCISLNMLLIPARLESNCQGWHSKTSRTYFLIKSRSHHQPLHCLKHTFRSNYETYCHSFSTNNIDLHVDSTRIIFGCCTSSLDILVVPVDLQNLCVRSTECM